MDVKLSQIIYENVDSYFGRFENPECKPLSGFKHFLKIIKCNWQYIKIYILNNSQISANAKNEHSVNKTIYLLLLLSTTVHFIISFHMLHF